MSRPIKIMNNNKIKKPSYVNTKINQIGKHQILGLILLSVIIIFALEMLSRRSVTNGLTFIMANPLMFVFNVLIVLLTLSISMMISRRYFALILISGLWLGLGITNFVILCYRSTPLTAMDFYLLKSVVGIIHVYLDSVKMVLISVICGMILIAMFFLWRKVKKYKIQIRIPMLIIGVTSISMLLLSSVATKVSALSDDFGNLPDAYADYGFAYCFSNSVFERGIREPEDYSQEVVDKVLDEIDNGPNQIYTESVTTAPATIQAEPGSIQSFSTPYTDTTEVKPNIIMIQLESFFDVNKLLDYSFSDDPIPNFTKLKNEFSSGYLTVPVYGAGTVNTEFEILAGMNLDFFGTGEYPYRTILQSTTSESICYNLDELGYDSYVIHNNTANFYNRNKIFPMLGFDYFSSIEYMNHIETNPTGWAKDKILTEQIMEALKSGETKDFIYSITVQSHGKYQETAIEDQKITVAADLYKRIRMGVVDEKTVGDLTVNTINTEESYLNQLQYYANQLWETDQLIGDLVNNLSTYEEPTIVIFFGDHLPSLSVDDIDVINGNRFQTEYVMWSNYSMDKVRLDLTAYQLSSYVMDRVGFDNGLLTKFHQRCIDNPDYQDSLKLLQYDMLYGEQYVYNGVNPYIEKPMKMGILDIKVRNIGTQGESSIMIYGENFTPSSVVYMNDEAKETTFMNANILTIPYEELNAPSVYVAQEAGGNKILSQSNTWTAHQ